MEKTEAGRELGWAWLGKMAGGGHARDWSEVERQEEMASEQGGSSLAEQVPAWPVGIRESERRERRLEIRLREGAAWRR
jgi:hypothetical protein